MSDEGKIALFDLDGTLCDYTGGLLKSLLMISNQVEREFLTSKECPDLHDLEDNHPHWKARMDLIKAQPGWWENLEELYDGFDILGEAASIGFETHVLTQGPRSTGTAWTQKFNWYQRHVLPRDKNANITITRDKGLVYGRVLVDDWPEYISRWLKHRPRGLVIMPDRPYNGDFTHPQVVRFNAKEEASVFAADMALREAHDR